MKQCSVSDCAGKSTSVGYCSRHYQQHYRGKAVGTIRAMNPRGACMIRDELGRKHCRRCDRWLEPKAFAKHGATADRLQTECRRCQVLRRHKLTLADFDDILESQGAACAICLSNEPGGRGYWHIDHDHDCCPGEQSCGECTRGILCHACNTGIGSLRDSPEILRRAADYLEREIARRKASHE